MSWPSSLASGEPQREEGAAPSVAQLPQRLALHPEPRMLILPQSLTACRSIGAELPDDVTLQDIIKTMPPEVRSSREVRASTAPRLRHLPTQTGTSSAAPVVCIHRTLTPNGAPVCAAGV